MLSVHTLRKRPKRRKPVDNPREHPVTCHTRGMSPQELPSLTPGQSFAVRDALRMGYTRSQLAGARYSRPFHGVRVLADPQEPSPDTHHDRVYELARAYMPLMRPEWAFSHTTALVLWGCPIRGSEDLHVSVGDRRGAPEAKGIRGHRHRAKIRSTEVAGVRVADPDLAIAQSGLSLTFIDLVVAIDHLIRPRWPLMAPIISRETLGRLLDEHSFEGVVPARKAWLASEVGAESRMETILRLRLAQHGIRGLDLQVEIFDDAGFVGRFDMADRLRRIIYEYDGEQHRIDRAQYLKDIERLDRARALGWQILRFHHEELFSGGEQFRNKLSRVL